MSTTSPILTLSLQGGQMIATDENNHSVFLPCDINGLRLVKQMLTAKKLLPKRFATESQPTQQMVEEFLKNKQLEKAIKTQEQMNELKELF